MKKRLATPGLVAVLCLGFASAAVRAEPATGTTDIPGAGCAPTVIPAVSTAPADPTDIAVVVGWLKSRMSDYYVRHAAYLIWVRVGPLGRGSYTAGLPPRQFACDPEMVIPRATDRHRALV